MVPQAIAQNRGVWLTSMSYPLTGNAQNNFIEMLVPLSAKELVALRKNPELIQRVKAIAIMPKESLLVEIKENFGFEIDMCLNGDIWIDTRHLEDLYPSWVTRSKRLPFGGWYLSYDSEDNSFERWARGFLTQDVRTELWERYLEDKLEKMKNVNKKSDSSDDIVGMYL